MDSPLTPIAERVARKRYYKKDPDGNFIEDWSGLCHRVVNYVCHKENKAFKEKMHDILCKTEFLPNSPCLVNSGTKIGGLTACHILPPVEDSWISMCENVANFGHVARRGGGVGVDLSKIRPEGDPVFGSTHARACGPIQHMRVISEAMSSITQAGFRSMACLATMRVDHPDILKFIRCKQRDNALRYLLKEDIFNHFEQINGATDEQTNIILDKFLSNFNISVLVTDDFMQRVKKNQNMDLVFNGKIYQTLPARDIFDTIVKNAWRNGDPGLLFFDTINDCSYKYSNQVITTPNPCFHGDSMVAVADGRNFVSIRQLAEEEKDVPVYCYDGQFFLIEIKWGRNPRKTRSNAQLCKVMFDDGGSIVTTPDHKICLGDGTYIEVQNLTIDSSVMTTFSNPGEKILQSCINHKVVSIEILENTDDVFNITVDDHHNLCILSSHEAKKTFSMFDWLKRMFGGSIKNGKKNKDVNSFKSIVYKNCGEIPGPSWTSCNLGSIDISKLVNKETIDWDYLRELIRHVVQFLDNVISRNKYPTNEFTKWAKDNRPIGLGIMGWADLLLKLKITYGSPESLKLATKLGKFFQNEAHIKSVELGKERGTPKSCRFKELDNRRNVTLLSIAPTGSISLLAGCSSSIEPIFSPIIIRNDNTGQYEMPHSDADKDYFRCAVGGKPENNITWQEHIAMQAAFQSYICSGISKTANLSHDATIEDVAEAYKMAWHKKCKGITIYRDGCKTTQVLNTEKKSGFIGYNTALNRPKELPCSIFKSRAQGFDWHIIIGLLNGNPYEIFAVNGGINLPDGGVVIKKKRRYYTLIDHEGNILIENLADAEEEIDPQISLETRRFSLELRHQIHPRYICEQIDKSNNIVTSFSKVVNRIMKKHYISIDEVSGEICEQCIKKGNVVELIPESGCWKCPVCLDARCG